MQGHESDEVRSLREVKAQAEVELEDARAVVEQADADISRAEAQFAAGKIPESTLDVRAPRLHDCTGCMLFADAPFHALAGGAQRKGCRSGYAAGC